MIVTIHDLSCDSEGCIGFFPMNPLADRTPDDVRRSAKRAGWDRVDGKDRCRRCRAVAGGESK